MEFLLIIVGLVLLRIWFLSERTMSAVDDLKADFATLKEVATKALAQLADTERQLAAAVAANDPTPLAQLHAEIQASNAELAAQLATLTPAASAEDHSA